MNENERWINDKCRVLSNTKWKDYIRSKCLFVKNNSNLNLILWYFRHVARARLWLQILLHISDTMSLHTYVIVQMQYADLIWPVARCFYSFCSGEAKQIIHYISKCLGTANNASCSAYYNYVLRQPKCNQLFSILLKYYCLNFLQLLFRMSYIDDSSNCVSSHQSTELIHLIWYCD